MSLNGEPNYDLYETNVGRGYRLSRGMGSLALGLGLLGVSVGYFVARKVAGGVSWGAKQSIESIASMVEYDYADSDQPIHVERPRKSS